MARLFDDASTEYLSNANAVLTTSPITVAGWGSWDDTATKVVLFSITDSDTDVDDYQIDIKDDGDVLRIIVVHDFGGGGQTVGLAATTNIVPSDGTWFHFCWIEDAVDSRRIILNGDWAQSGTNATSSQPTGLDKTGIGALVTNTIVTHHSGMLAEIGVWNVALNQAENEALAKGYSPLFIRPQNRVSYWPLVRGLNDSVGGYNMTASGTVVSAHPRTIRPSKIWVPHKAAAAALARAKIDCGLASTSPLVRGLVA